MSYPCLHAFLIDFEGDDHTYVLLSKYSGGASCCYSYNVVDMSGHNPVTSKEFDYGFKMTKTEVDKGTLRIEAISHDQKHKITYTYTSILQMEKEASE